ncbi:MAG: ribulose-phosphate 3-epimerase [Caldisericia bacterium]|nr:ribulose-phosphate 3-epimerase [Caldisericia bacterium]
MKIAPSILAANFKNLEIEIKLAEEFGNIIHLDIMDGHFVPNISFGFPIVKAVRELTNLPLDAHLMIEKPELYIDRFIDCGVNMISVHLENNYHINRLINNIKIKGALAGVAINPGTSIYNLDSVIKDIDYVLIMSVNPGFSGQNFIESSIEKIQKIVNIKNEMGLKFQIEVDGGLNYEIALKLKEIGVDIVVFGDYFFKNKKENLYILRNLL